MEVGSVETTIEVSGGRNPDRNGNGSHRRLQGHGCPQFDPDEFAQFVGRAQPVSGSAGAGRKQRHPLCRQPREREQLVHRRNHVLRWRR